MADLLTLADDATPLAREIAVVALVEVRVLDRAPELTSDPSRTTPASTDGSRHSLWAAATSAYRAAAVSERI